MVFTIGIGSEVHSTDDSHYQPHQLSQKKQCSWGAHSMPRTLQLAPLLCLTSEEVVLEGTYTTNNQKKSIYAVESGIIFKDNSKAHIIPNPL